MMKEMTLLLKFLALFLIVITFSSITNSVALKPVTTNDNPLNKNSSKNITATIHKPAINELSQYYMNTTFFTANASLITEMNYSYLNTEDVALNYLFFNLWPNFIVSNSLNIQSINHNSQSLEYSLTGTNYSYFLVNLTQAVNPGSRYNLQINFTLKLPYTEDRFGYQLQQNGSLHDIYALTNWYPILAVYQYGNFVLQPYTPNGEAFYCDMAYYNVSLTADKNLVIASGGQLYTHTSDSVLQYNTYSFYPAREISFILSPDYIVSSQQDGNITVYSYYFPEDLSVGSRSLSSIVSAINLFSSLYTPYPYNSMSVVDFIFGYGGMEYSGLVEITNTAYNQTFYNQNPDNFYIWNFEYIMVHEVSHDWNTYLVADNPYVDPWLDEAFAMYSSVLYLEFIWGTSYSNQQLNWEQYQVNLSVNDYGINDPIGNGMHFWDHSNKILYNDYYYTVYVKGCLFFNFLRDYLGNNTFFSFVSQYFINFSYKTVNGTQFLNLLNGVSGQNLTWIFSTFIYNSVYFNSFSIDNPTVRVNTTANTQNIEFTLNQISNYSVSLKIPILLRFASGIENVWTWLNGTSSLVNVSVNSNLGSLINVVIDPNWIYFRNSISFDFPVTPTTITSPTSTSSPSSMITSSSTISSKTTTGPNINTSPGFELLTILPIVIISFVTRKKYHQR